MENKIAYEARAEYLKGSDEVGVLVIHGFTGSTQSMRDIAYRLHKAGYSVNMPCLKGHGTTAEDMEIATFQDWIESVENAYSELSAKVKNVFVLGLSMGGTLTLYTAINHKIKGAITVNAAVDIPEFAKIYDNPATPRFFGGVGSDIKKPGVKEWAYDKTPKRSVKEIVSLTELVKRDLGEITCPILIFKSIDDHVVPPTNQNYIFSNVSSNKKELIELANSYHVATIDNDWETIADKTINFIEANED